MHALFVPSWGCRGEKSNMLIKDLFKDIKALILKQ